jgi:glutaredoxin-like protein
MLRDGDVVEIRKRFERLVNPVKLVHFTQELNLEYGREARQLLQELAEITDKISLEVFNFLIDQDKVAESGVDKVPATVVRNGESYGIRFYGLPAGYEFSSLLDAILSVSAGDTGLSDESKEKLRKITKPLHLEVFVTPTWPHCPRAVRLAHQFAMENDLIEADCIEATEFPELAEKHRVYGVPKTVINGSAFIEGSMPESLFLDSILKSIEPSPGEAPQK